MLALAAIGAGTPVAAAAAAPVAAAPAPAAADGKKIYDASCVACHGAGVAGAPKFGDKAAWAARAPLGIAALTAAVVKGKGAMPPMGVDNAILGDLPQPQVKRHRRVFQVVAEAAIRLDHHVLHHVADADASLDPLVQTHADHPLDGPGVAVQQLVDGAGVALFGAQEQFVRLFGFRPHGSKGTGVRISQCPGTPWRGFSRDRVPHLHCKPLS